MPLNVIGSSAILHPVSRMDGQDSFKTRGVAMDRIRQGTDRDGINLPLRRIRPVKKNDFFRSLSNPDLRSPAAVFRPRLLSTSMTPPIAIAAGGPDNTAQSRARRRAVGALEMTLRTGIAAAPEIGAIPSGYANTASAALASDWQAAINWNAYDKADMHISRQGYFDNLEAMYGWLPDGALADRLPLDIAQFDRAALERFHASAMSAMGYAVSPGQSTDPAFLQYLLKDFFLHNVAPSMQDGNGHTGVPFTRRLLLALRHDAGPVAPLLHMTALKVDLKNRFLHHNKMFYPGSRHQRDLKLAWIFEGLCQLAEPTLMRRDLPGNFRYGSLEWVLLSFGMHLAGDAHWQLRAEDLIVLAISSDIAKINAETVSGPVDENQAVTGQMAMRLILLMAHAHGKLNLLMPDLTQENIDAAFALFKEKWSALMENSEPLAQCMLRLPKRSDVARVMLQENGLDADGQCFSAGPRSYQAVRSLRKLPPLCAPAGKKYRMHEVLMMDCMGSSQFGDQLSLELSGQLATPALSHAVLARRFQQQFDEALLPLSREIMLPLLEHRIKQMDSDDARFWREGVWTVRVPTVSLQSRTTVSQIVGQFYAGESHTAFGKQQMKGVLVQLARERNGQLESHHYWATFHPFELRRYHGHDMALLESQIGRFFPTAETVRQPSIRPGSINYEVHSSVNSQDNLLQSVTALLLRSCTPELLDYASEVTQVEKTRANREEMLLNLIPLRFSIKSIQAGELGFTTKLGILFDVASLLPFLSAGASLGKAGIGIGKSMTAGQIVNAARAAMLGGVNKLNGMHAVPLVINIGRPTVNLSIAGVRFLDIGIELSFNAMAGSFRLSAAAIRSLKHKFHGIRQLKPLAAALDRALLIRQNLYRQDLGFWRTRSDVDARTVGVGQLQIGSDETDYFVFAIGDIGNVIAVREGAGFRLANPDSGLGYGPLLQKSGVAGKLELAPVPAGGGSRAVHSLAPRLQPEIAGRLLCRTRRANGNIPACVRQDIRIGHRVLYYWTGFLADEIYQLPLLARTDAASGAVGLMVDAGKRRFSISRSLASGRIDDMVPELTGQSLLARARPVLTEDSDVWLVSGANAQGDATNHLELSIADTGGGIVTTHYMPFGTYEGLALNPLEWPNVEYKHINTEVVGIVYLVSGDPATAYRFTYIKNRMPMRKDGPVKVRLWPASTDVVDKYRKFQSMIVRGQAAYLAFITDAYKLGSAGPALQDRFAAVFLRANELLDQAHYAFTREPGKVRHICKTILNLPFSLENIKKIDRVVAAARAQIGNMRILMPELQRQSVHVIGFYADTTNSGTLAAAFPSSLAGNLDLSNIQNPLVLFDSNYLMRDDVALDNHAATLIHEYSHALFDTDDAMVAGGPDIYATSGHDNQFTMTPISAAAAQPESVPENHAPTLEHLIVLAAYADDKNKNMLSLFLSEKQVPGNAVYPRYWKFGQGQEVRAGTGGKPPLCRNKRTAGATGICGSLPAPASAGEHGKNYLYREILNSHWPAPEAVPAGLVKLGDRSPAFQRKFRFLLSRTQTILDDAVAAMERDHPLFAAICRCFSSLAYGPEIIAPDLAQSLRKMRDSFDYFKSQCEYVFGFYSLAQDDNAVRSQAYPHAMEYEIDFSAMNKTLANFDARNFNPAAQFDDHQAALLLYDYARLLTGVNDHAVGPGSARLYANGHARNIDLATSIAAVHASGNSPAAYAFTVQHAAMLLAYGRSPAKRPYIESFLGIGRE